MTTQKPAAKKAAKKKVKPQRETVRTQQMAEAILSAIAEGTPLRQFCRDNPISKSVVYEWLDADTAFAGRFAQARARGFDHLAEETLEIADDGTNDWMERAGKDGESPTMAFNAEHVQRSKLRIDTRLKLLAKWDPKRYGERTVLAGDPDAPLLGATTMTDQQLADIARQGGAKAKGAAK